MGNRDGSWTSPGGDPGGSQPLSRVALHVLVALAGGSRHGYAIAQEVERVSGGAIRMGPGTLYGSLQRLQDAGLIEAVDAPEDAAGAHAERRRYYALSSLGLQTLRNDAQRLAHTLQLIRQRLGSDAVG